MTRKELKAIKAKKRTARKIRLERQKSKAVMPPKPIIEPISLPVRRIRDIDFTEALVLLSVMGNRRK